MENIFESSIYLPRVLVKDNGHINLELIDKIWSLHPKARGAKKSLSKSLIHSAKSTSTHQAFEEIVSDKRLLSKWFEQAVFKERSMCALILRAAAAEEPALRFESLTAAGFLEKKRELNDAYRFNIENINIFLDAIATYKGDQDILGLYVWAIIIESRAAAIKFQKEESFSALEPKLLAALKDCKLTQVLFRIEGASLNPRGGECTKLAVEKNSPPPAIDELKEKLHDEKRARLQQLKRLEDRCNVFNRELAIISARTQTLQFEPGVSESLNSLSSLVESLKQDVPIIVEEYKALYASTGLAIDESIRNLGLKVISNELEGKPTSWNSEIEARIETIFELGVRFSGQLPFKESGGLSDSAEIEAVPLEMVVSRASDEVNKALVIERSRKQYERLVESVNANHLDLTWNAFRNSAFDVQAWSDVFKHCNHIESLGPLVGISSYCAFNETENQLATTLRNITLSTAEGLHSCLDILSCLNTCQLEALAKQHSDLKTVISLVLIEGFLSAAESQSYSHAFAFWSIYPLSESYAAHSSLVIRGLFSALFQLSTDDSSLLNHQSLKIAISGAKTDDVNNKDHELDRLARQLDEVLRYRRKAGGVTYSQIWEAAYNSTLEPLNKVYSKSGINGFFNSYRKWVDEFEIDKNIEAWKAAIPEHLKKDSVYDRFIRTQLQLKISELNGLDEIYCSLTSPQNTRKESLSSLKAAIKSILGSADKDAAIVRAWLEIKSNGLRGLFNPYISTARTLHPGDDAYDLSKLDVRFPRAFSTHELAQVNTSSIYTDLLVKSLDLSTADNLIRSYLEFEFIDGVQQLLSDERFYISPEVERTAERKLEEVGSLVHAEMESLSSCLGIDIDGVLRNLLKRAQESLDEGHIGKAQAILEETKKATEELKARAIEAGRTARIIEKLNHLEDSAYNPSSSAAELEAYYAYQLSENLPRRRHIFVLKRLEAVPQSDLVSAVIESSDSLECYSRYPDASTSESAAFYWEQAVDPLLKELVRSKTLLPDYLEKLLQLGRMVCRNIIEDFDVVQENSRLNQALVQTAEQWSRLPDNGLEAANDIFESFERLGIIYIEPEVDKLEVIEDEITLAPNAEVLSLENYSNSILFEAAKKWHLENADSSFRSKVADFVEVVRANNWTIALQMSAWRLYSSGFEEKEDLENWLMSAALSGDHELSIEHLANALQLITPRSKSQIARYISTERSAKNLIEELCLKFVINLAEGAGRAGGKRGLDAANISECIQFIYENLEESIKHKDSFRTAFSSSSLDAMPLKALWDKFSGGSRQAETRAQIMALAWKFSATNALAFCLSQPPIEMEKRKSNALAVAADQALLLGNSSLLQPFLDLRSKLTARPFQIFVDILSRSIVDSNEIPAKLNLISNLEKQPDQTYRATMKIEPRRIDCPDSITLRLPLNAPVRFAGAASSLVLNGPFLSDSSTHVSFDLKDSTAQSFDIQLSCIATSITGKVAEFNQTLRFITSGSHGFSPLSLDEIEEAYDYFPSNHMRGEDYVPRVADEQKIERALFKSKIVRSLWITSPRRSGKTSMLFRIVDGYSHKEGRDNLVVFLTIDTYFDSVSAFNRWLWKRIQSIRPNEELRDLYDDFASLGVDLPYDADAGTFIGTLADRFLANWSQGNRVIFLIDEVDRLASMYFQGGASRTTAMDILWQMRHYIAQRRDIGIVFAGSSAAKELFISRAESPFYNSIDHLELSAFATKTKQQEEYSRQLVEPQKVRGVYTLPKETLDYLIWLCSGIPYYMKLVAGATLSRAMQSHLLVADVNEGLRALLNRDTGISKLDDMGGEPGSDDLRTIVGLDQASDALLAKAVLYAFAEIHSPISGGRTYRGKISSPESKLVYIYSLSRPMIDKGLDLCLKLGLLKLIATDTAPAIDFTIPLLGEAIRKASPRLWATIDHELTKLAAVGEKN
ncbi:TPA: hypothetical protein L4S14_001561 [Pseudomonas aeruginosa]|nr:hypothetical protein [Pseudomonas aeruginosa]